MMFAGIRGRTRPSFYDLKPGIRFRQIANGKALTDK